MFSIKNIQSYSAVLSITLHISVFIPLSYYFPDIKIKNTNDTGRTIEFEFYEPEPENGPRGTPFLPGILPEKRNNTEKEKKSALSAPPPSLMDASELKPLKTGAEISDSYREEIRLKKLIETETIKWDYCNRVRMLIQNHMTFPKSLSSKKIRDIVKIEITLNRKGELIKGTPRINIREASRYEELNIAAVQIIKSISSLFPPVPDRYPEDEITFSIPVKFESK